MLYDTKALAICGRFFGVDKYQLFCYNRVLLDDYSGNIEEYKYYGTGAFHLLGHRGVTDPGMRWKQGFNRYEADLYTTFIPEENRLDQKRPRGCFFCAKRELNLS